MKTKPFALTLCLALFSMSLLLAGCGTSPASVDWSSRVGNYTLSQARTDLGSPSQSAALPDGGTSAEWLTHLGTAMPATVGTQYSMRAGGVDQPTGVGGGFGSKSEYIHLTFDAGGKLVKWERIYR